MKSSKVKAPAANAWVKFGEMKKGRRMEDATDNNCLDSRPPTAAQLLQQHQATNSLENVTSALTLSPERIRVSKNTVLLRSPEGMIKYETLSEKKKNKLKELKLHQFCGHKSPLGKPFRPIEGVESFIQQRDDFVKMVERAKEDTSMISRPSRPVPIVPNKPTKASLGKYDQRMYYFDLSLTPMVREAPPNTQFQVSFELEANQGDPDLYIGAEIQPDILEYTWASAGIGEDKITVLPTDPHFVMGKYFILVYSPAIESSFTLTVRPKVYVDEIPAAVMSEAKKQLYHQIKKFILTSDNRRQLCKIGTQNWNGILKNISASTKSRDRPNSAERTKEKIPMRKGAVSEMRQHYPIKSSNNAAADQFHLPSLVPNDKRARNKRKSSYNIEQSHPTNILALADNHHINNNNSNIGTTVKVAMAARKMERRGNVLGGLERRGYHRVHGAGMDGTAFDRTIMWRDQSPITKYPFPDLPPYSPSKN